MTSPTEPSFDFSDSETPVDPQAGHPGEVFHVGGQASPPPPVGEVREKTPVAAGGVSRGAFLAVLIYASAATAVCLGLAYLLFVDRGSPLESLPDVVPPREGEQIGRVIVPADAEVPEGHVLRLGETRRFGDLLVTPLRVTREELRFVHSRGMSTREPAGEVLKLWLKFENVSERGTAFAPLDAELLFYRTIDEPPKANNYVAPAGDRSGDRLVFVFDHPPGSEWDLAGQRLGAVLEPGGSVETYVPTTAGPPAPDGPMAWRVHLRKGVAGNGWGVTTLVEVRFEAGDVQAGV